LYDRLLKIDELTRKDHTYLRPDDICLHLGEYFSGQGFDHSRTNGLIHNLKKPVDRRGKPEWRYKEQAIATIAEDLRRLLGQTAIERFTFIPIPPSKTKNDSLYDDRLVRILTQMGSGFQMDMREMLIQLRSSQANHTAPVRLSPNELSQNLSIEERLTVPEPTQIILFDDLLTAGSHYRACHDKLTTRFPNARIYGVFVARRALPKLEDDFDVIDDSA